MTTPEKRSAIFRWILVLATIAASVYLALGWRPGLFEAIVAVSLAGLVILIQNLGLKTSYG